MVNYQECLHSVITQIMLNILLFSSSSLFQINFLFLGLDLLNSTIFLKKIHWFVH